MGDLRNLICILELLYSFILLKQVVQNVLKKTLLFTCIHVYLPLPDHNTNSLHTNQEKPCSVSHVSSSVTKHATWSLVHEYLCPADTKYMFLQFYITGGAVITLAWSLHLFLCVFVCVYVCVCLFVCVCVCVCNFFFRSLYGYFCVPNKVAKIEDQGGHQKSFFLERGIFRPVGLSDVIEVVAVLQNMYVCN